jgi:hypothetical protein
MALRKSGGNVWGSSSSIFVFVMLTASVRKS